MNKARLKELIDGLPKIKHFDILRFIKADNKDLAAGGLLDENSCGYAACVIGSMPVIHKDENLRWSWIGFGGVEYREDGFLYEYFDVFEKFYDVNSQTAVLICEPSLYNDLENAQDEAIKRLNILLEQGEEKLAEYVVSEYREGGMDYHEVYEIAEYYDIPFEHKEPK